MGTQRHYHRLTPAELERAIVERAWADAFLGEQWDAVIADLPEERPVAERRMLDFDKCWYEIDPLLHVHGITTAVHLGTRLLPPDPERPADGRIPDEWGTYFCEPTYLTPDEVAEAARILGPLDLVAMHRAVDVAAAGERLGYPYDEWGTIEEVAEQWGPRLQAFFVAAAAAGDAMVATTC